MVLLHVVAPPLAVDDALHPVGGEGPVEDVEDLAAVLEDGDHARLPETAGVAGLPPALGVERGPVEHDGGAALVLVAGDDGGIELEQARVGEEEAFGHVVGTGRSSAPSSR